MSVTTGLRRRARTAALAQTLAVALAAPHAAHGAVALSMERASPASADVVVRWESDASGPFTLLRRRLAPDVAPGPELPLDPVADAWLTGLPGGEVTLPDEAAVPSGVDGFVQVTLYGIVDGSGGCSNVGYIAFRQMPAANGAGGGPGERVSLPARGSIVDAVSLLSALPTIRRVAMWERGGCGRVFLERLPDGTYHGRNFEIPPWQGIVVTPEVARPIVLVGAADSTPRAVDTGQPMGCFEDIAWPWGSVTADSVSVACGREGIDWQDASGDGRPDTCEHGLLGVTYSILSVESARSLSSSSKLGVTAYGSPPLYWGAWQPFPVLPAVGLRNYRTPPSVIRAEPRDAGGAPECRCADSDGDGEDDCTERLVGSDPFDPSSWGRDRDGDGVADRVDACPADPDPEQDDADGDGAGDVCDPCPIDGADACVDADGDGFPEGFDDCPAWAGLQRDRDEDGVGDACDVCPRMPDDQLDEDGDGVGSACDPCPRTPDLDGDAACDDIDNCIYLANSDQSDVDGDGFGDACDCLSPSEPAPEVRDVRVARTVGLGFGRLLTWSDDRLEPSLEVFDVATGPILDLRADRGFRNVECLASSLREPRAVVAFRPGSLWFLVARRSACQVPYWGRSSEPDLDARAILTLDPPCP